MEFTQKLKTQAKRSKAGTMKTRLICIMALLLFASLLFAGADPFTAKNGSTKHEIVDSLLAVNNLSGAIYYRQNYIEITVDHVSGEAYIGDFYSWISMTTHFASIVYLSFELPSIPEGYKIKSANLMMYLGGMKGNSTSGVYPIFNYGDAVVNPEGILEHIDYGSVFNSNDVIPDSVYASYTFFTYETLMPPTWVTYDVTECLLMDYAANRSLTQYRIYLDGFSDWDNREDYIATNTSSYSFFQYSPKIVYTLSDGVSNSDPSIPQAQFAISSYPNPFSDKSTITIKIAESGQCKLNIYNIKGQRIRTHNIYAKTAGDHAFQWDAKDDKGNQLSGGIYFVVLEKGKYKASSKILYLR